MTSGLFGEISIYCARLILLIAVALKLYDSRDARPGVCASDGSCKLCIQST